jgi:argininosuccinate synthase
MKTTVPYIKVSSYEGKKGEVKRVVLLYSGGLDTSMMLKWIQDEYEAEVIALTIDIGQQADDLEAIRKKALKLGAIEAVVVDAKKEFAYHYLAKGIKANASYQGSYHMSTPMGRPLLAKKAVEVARQFDADTIAHGATGKGNDQVRIEGSILTMAPEMKIIAPVREWSMGRDDQLEYVKKHNIPVKQTKDSPYSYDDNMWGVTGESGEIENPALIPPLEKILQVCTVPEKAPNKSEYIDIGFVKGLPISINGKEMGLVEIIDKLNKIGAKHGVGITHHIEDRLVGLKVRGLYEAPAAEIIIQAHFNLEKYVSTRLENEMKTMVDQKWAYLCYGAQWYEPLMKNLEAYIDAQNEKVTGKVTVQLLKGRAEVVALETPNALYQEKLATFMKDDTFNQNSSAGFIEIYTMQMRLSQETERYAFFTIGDESDKKKYVKLAQRLLKLGFALYATENTQTYFAKQGVETVLLHKMYEQQNPNLEDLLKQNRFDLIFHAPYKKASQESTDDAKLMKKWSVKNGTPYITDYEVAEKTVQKLEAKLVAKK